MKKIICYLSFVLLTAFMPANSIYNYSITTIDGNEISLSNFAGKPMLLVVLPSSHQQSDSILLQEMDSIYRKYVDSLVVIGIPSYEDGFEDDSTQSLSSWYKEILSDSIVISQGLNTRKSSPYQAEIFQWITDKDFNGHFNEDVTGAGAKYFINKRGELYGVLSATASLYDSTVETILQQNN